VLAVSLWGLTSALSIVLIPLVIDLVAKVYAAFWADYDLQGHTYWGVGAL